MDKKKARRSARDAAAKAKDSIGTQAARLALQRYEFGQATSGLLFAVPKGGHIIRPLRAKGSSRILDELAAQFYEKTGRLVTGQSLEPVRTLMRARAAQCEPVEVALRVAYCKGQVVIDLGDAAESVVIVDPSDPKGWRVSSTSPVQFRRNAVTGAFPTPKRGGDIRRLSKLINSSQEDFDLLVAWMVTQFLPHIPRGILLVNGIAGSAKTDTSRMLARLIDPSAAPMRTPPKSADDFIVTAAGSYLVGLENLSNIPEWLSDLLCSVVTGVGSAKRELYSDDGISLVSVGRRAVIINGIEVGGIRADLSDRLVRMELLPIDPAKRMLEAEVERRFQKLWPHVFGAVLDTLAEVLAVMERGDQHLAERPRMADFAEGLRAVDLVRKTSACESYLESLKRSAIQAAEDDLVVQVLRQFLSTPSVDGQWKGTATQLLANLNAIRPDNHPTRKWPEESRGLGRRLTRLQASLLQAGWSVDRVPIGKSQGWAIGLPAPDSEGVADA